MHSSKSRENRVLKEKKTSNSLLINTGRMPGSCIPMIKAILDLDRVAPVPCLTGSNSQCMPAASTSVLWRMLPLAWSIPCFSHITSWYLPRAAVAAALANVNLSQILSLIFIAIVISEQLIGSKTSSCGAEHPISHSARQALPNRLAALYLTRGVHEMTTFMICMIAGNEVQPGKIILILYAYQ